MDVYLVWTEWKARYGDFTADETDLYGVYANRDLADEAVTKILEEGKGIKVSVQRWNVDGSE